MCWAISSHMGRVLEYVGRVLEYVGRVLYILLAEEVPNVARVVL